MQADYERKWNTADSFSQYKMFVFLFLSVNNQITQNAPKKVTILLRDTWIGFIVELKAWSTRLYHSLYIVNVACGGVISLNCSAR